MLPSILSRETKEGIKLFLQSTFPPSTRHFEGALEELIDAPGKVFKGPYFSVRLPFRSWGAGMPFQFVTYPYEQPYHHQGLAFQRLCGEIPKSTLVATGTGSGKTECFLYPILEHCAANPSTAGIKAIIIYPMNALATDQAKRFAEAISQDKALESVRVGLYVGGEGDDTTSMQPDRVITSRNEMKSNPPDVLLTNYKMLDYLLVRPDDRELWAENLSDTLRYIAVDELHTFDGAQATDLACLLRRLKKRLNTPKGHICCVGTSATVGSADDEKQLLTYASKLFSEEFDEAGSGSVIRENLLTEPEFNEGFYINHQVMPSADDIDQLSPGTHHDLDSYLRAQYAQWFDREAPSDILNKEWRCQLGDDLRRHMMLRNLLLFLAKTAGSRPVDEAGLLQEMARMNPDFADPALAFKVLDSLASLCAHARYRHPETGAVFPFLKLHVHLWMRELARIVSSVAELPDPDGMRVGPQIAFSADLKEERLKRSLPVIHCRECGVMGWGGTMRQNDDQLRPDPDKFYQAFFGRHPSLRLVFPAPGNATDALFSQCLCGHCLQLFEGAKKGEQPIAECPNCGEGTLIVPVTVCSETDAKQDKVQAKKDCPSCGSSRGLTILGSRAASLASVALGHSFATPFNDDKKALTFSDNVQDASHRAAFFSARTYRTTLRTALCKVMPEDSAPVSLTLFQNSVVSYWLKLLGRRDFIGTFLTPDMESEQDYEKLCSSGELPKKSSLTKMVQDRLRWEVAVEFGYRSRTGRTLEKSGALAAHFDTDLIAVATKQLAECISEKGGGLASFADKPLEPLLLGLLHRLRIVGGIVQPVLAGYFKSMGDPYLLNHLPWMPSYRRGSPAPTFYFMGADNSRRFERTVSAGGTPSKPQRWINQCLSPGKPLDKDIAAELLEDSMAALVGAGLLKEVDARAGERVWGIAPEQLLISPRIIQLRCNQCGHSASTAEEEQELWHERMPCHRDCPGVYQSQPEQPSYFRDLYRAGQVERIHAKEHTGLLERKVREKTENDFMRKPGDRRKTDPNILSCTPTLEMGVDIGDLSTVLLCSVPKTTASYTQRIGRAGRRDGNAFSLTLANARPDDLYFYAEPQEMISGDVRTPGVFLDAPAVLERQFVAFCFDRWVVSSTPSPSLPKKLKPALANVLNPSDPPSGFPYDLLAFIQGEVKGHLQAFFELFELFGDSKISDRSKTYLRAFAEGDNSEGSLSWKLLNRLKEMAEELEDLVKRRSKVAKDIKKLDAVEPKDDATEKELSDMRGSRSSLDEIIKKIRNTNIFEFLTDEGLLPNYAFPEDGVTLRSIILRKRVPNADDSRDKKKKGNYDALSLEYQRPAAMALREFAPGNHFYAEGRKLTIDQVNLKLSDPEKWGFCDRCNYVERLFDGHASGACPACGSKNWGDASLAREMLRMRQVITTESDRRSRTADDSDQRTPEFYNSLLSVWVSPDEVEKAYQLEGGIPFGYEFVRKVEIRDINLGQDSNDTETVAMAGQERQAAGFSVCRKCGAVKTRNKDFRHDISCPDRKEEKEPVLNAYYLYRELQSEALRILLPSISSSPTAETTSFIAALRIGLRSHFGGDIDHLQSCPDFRQIENTSMRRNYLVVYDAVKGGTGYLKELSDGPDRFLEVLEKGLKEIQDCPCHSDPDSDGCHRCVLGANRHRTASTPSRGVAIRLLEAILQQKGGLKEVKSLTAIDVDPLIESELERIFLEMLRGIDSFDLRGRLIEGHNGYRLRAGNQKWDVIPQVEIKNDGATIRSTRPDFVLRPRPAPEGVKQIAVYLDGFAYHADEAGGNNRIADDLAKREGLRRSGKWHVWSLSWDDLSGEGGSGFSHPGLEKKECDRRDLLLKGLGWNHELREIEELSKLSSWNLLRTYLETPQLELFRHWGFVLASSSGKPVTTSSDDLTKAVELLATGRAKEISIENQPGEMHVAYFKQEGEYDRWQLLYALQKNKSREVDRLQMIIVFNDDQALEKELLLGSWRGLHRMMNIFGFLPNVHFTTVRALTNGDETSLEELWDGSREFSASLEHEGTARWVLDSDLYHRRTAPLIPLIQAAGLDAPEAGYELVDESGEILGDAELVWPAAKVALILEEMEDETAVFENGGWKTVLWKTETKADIIAKQLIEFLS